jgi:hypothetical protein
MVVSRPRHPNKDVEEAVQYAESENWTVRMQGHWGRMYCAQADRDGCQVGISGTPKNPGNHARQLKRAVDRCPHKSKQEADDGNI